ncbi:MAG: hypothetical protein CML88_02710 [Rhodobiaceae bacterium]|nr:hypothetical protein [Rhodobiaceae bacterium]
MIDAFLSQIAFSEVLIAFVIVYIASSAQSLFGMGWGMIAAPFLALLDPSLIPSTIVFLGFFAALFPGIRYFKDIHWETFRPSISGRIFGSILAGWIAAYVVASGKIEIIVGIVLLISILISALTVKRIAQNSYNHFFAGTASGILGTIVGVGGAPMGIIYQNENPSIVRANNNLFFTIGSLVSFIVLISAGVIEDYHIIYGFLMLPPLFFASYTSKFLLTYASKILKTYILSICSFSSLLLIARGLGLI